MIGDINTIPVVPGRSVGTRESWAERMIAIVWHVVVVIGLKEAFKVSEMVSNIGNCLCHNEIAVHCGLE